MAVSRSHVRMEDSGAPRRYAVQEAVRIQHDSQATIIEKEQAAQVFVSLFDYYTDGKFSLEESDQ